MPSEHDNPNVRKFLAMYRGVVVDNKDPDRLGRVRLRVPGVIPKEGSAWAYPIGAPGAGSAQRGWYVGPTIGTDVAVWFEQGDPDHPYYMGGNPGDGEVPPEVVAAADAEDATKVAVFETDRWRLKFDGTAGNEEFHILDKVTGDVFEIDGVAKGIRIKGTGVVFIESDGAITLTAPAITIGGRPVTQNGKPLN